MGFGNVSILGVVVAAVVSFLLGWLWYSPALFAKPWMKLVGLTEKKMKKAKKSMGAMMLLAIVSQLVLMYIFANILFLVKANTPVDAAVMGFYVWLGFLATTQLGSFLWELKPIKLYFINTLFWLLSLVVAGLILGAFSAYGY